MNDAILIINFTLNNDKGDSNCSGQLKWYFYRTLCRGLWAAIV